MTPDARNAVGVIVLLAICSVCAWLIGYYNGYKSHTEKTKESSHASD